MAPSQKNLFAQTLSSVADSLSLFMDMKRPVERTYASDDEGSVTFVYYEKTEVDAAFDRMVELVHESMTVLRELADTSRDMMQSKNPEVERLAHEIFVRARGQSITPDQAFTHARSFVEYQNRLRTERV